MNEQKQERSGGDVDACPSATPLARVAVYHGVSAQSGRCRLKIENVPMFGRGQLFAVAASGRWEQWPSERGIEFDTSCRSEGLVEILDCVHHETGWPMRFVGYLEANHTPGIRDGDGDGSSVSVAAPNIAASRGSLLPNAHTRRPTRDEAFEAELARYTQLRNQGVDPSLKLPFIKAYTGKSHSTIYREIARGKFPPAIRHGKSVSWLMSHVDAYRRGNWMRATGTTAAGPT